MNILLVKAQGRIFESSSFLYITTGNRGICKYSQEQGVEETMPKQRKYREQLDLMRVCMWNWQWFCFGLTGLALS